MRSHHGTLAAIAVFFCGTVPLAAEDLYADGLEQEPVQVLTITPPTDVRDRTENLARFGRTAADAELILKGKATKAHVESLFTVLEREPQLKEPVMLLLKIQFNNKALAPLIDEKMLAFSKAHPEAFLPNSIAAEELLRNAKYEEAFPLFGNAVRVLARPDMIAYLQENSDNIYGTVFISVLPKWELCAIRLRNDEALRKTDGICAALTDPGLRLLVLNERISQMTVLRNRAEDPLKIMGTVFYDVTDDAAAMARIDGIIPAYTDALVTIVSDGKRRFSEKKHMQTWKAISDHCKAEQNPVIRAFSDKIAGQERTKAKTVPGMYRVLAVNYSLAGKHELSADTWSKLIRVTGGKNPLFYLECAGEQARAGQHGKSLEQIISAARLLPEKDRKVLILETAGHLLRDKQYDSAMKLAKMLPDDDFDGAYLRMLLCYFKKDTPAMFPAAKNALALLEKKKISLTANQDRTLVILDILTRCGEYDVTERVLRQMLKEKPDEPILLNFLAYNFAVIGKNLPEAKAMLEKALKKEPDVSAYLDSMAWVLYKMKDCKQASVYMARALAARKKEKPDQPPDAELCDHAGDIWMALGDREKAVEFWKAALKDKDTDYDLGPIREKIRSAEKNKDKKK